jgi:ABC-type Fe3+-hydroxamate transport system substrate-binding protein
MNFSESKNKTIVDMLGRTIVLPNTPHLRIISLVPSQTELLVDLGLEKQLVGLTKFCIHPKEVFQTKPRIGGTKQFDFDKIKSLRPDIIIANKEENEQSQIEQLCQDYPVWISDIFTLEDNNQMIVQLGDIFDKQDQAQAIVDQINKGFSSIPKLPVAIRTAYFIWRNPYMVAGNKTFINHILARLGFDNVFEKREDSRYPEINEAALKQASPQLMLLSSEPYPFSDKHMQELNVVCPEAHIELVDGELFSWYGSRLIHAPAYFNALIDKLNHRYFLKSN